ncbi:MAG TPA: hypothetical protein VEZ71_12660 [Archangium sp.]|nr:hypothetical protein [Archangium sp.]
MKPDAGVVGGNWSTPIIASYFGDTSKVPGGDELPLNWGCTVPCTGAARGLAGPRSGPSRPLRSSPHPPPGFLSRLYA